MQINQIYLSSSLNNVNRAPKKDRRASKYKKWRLEVWKLDFLFTETARTTVTSFRYG